MKRISVILICLYYLFGNLCLPGGDFSFLVDIPPMYKHCKATEDKDITFFDFITDHLINFDELFDSHNNGDEQKPHQPPAKTVNSFQQPVFYATNILSNNPEFKTLKINYYFLESKHIFDYKNFVFRPPIQLS